MDGTNLGAGVGLGSMIYGLAAVGEWLADPQLIEEAALVAEELTTSRIASDGAFDVVYGSAGAILGLCRLHTSSPNAKVRDAAQRCGDHLLACRSDAGEGLRAWATPDRVHLSGFSHGAAGIAYALCRLHELVPSAAYQAAAEEAIAFERRLYEAGAGAWLPAAGTDSGLVSWCRGGAGIGLGRLGVLAHFDGADLLTDLDTCVAETLRFGLSGIDHLCCGNFGRIEFLQMAGCRLQRMDCTDVAHAWAARVIHRAREGSGFQVASRLPTTFNHPGLFQGLAGIGYGCLRLADPDAAPSLLLFE